MISAKLVDLYASYGFQIRSSMSPFLLTKISNSPAEDGTFTYAIKDGVNIGHSGGGISLSEVALMEDIGQVYAPQRVFAIGCSFGWSTLALAMAMPKAKIVAIDIGLGMGKDGLELTNRIATERNYNVTDVLGASPADVPATVAAHLDGPVDMVFIDADHTNEAQTADFEGILPFCAPDAVFVFHDVMVCQMLDSFRAIAARLPGHKARILTRTASGMGVLAPSGKLPELHHILDIYCDPFGVVAV
jgi:predicted O-methyltransferase YrrM